MYRAAVFSEDRMHRLSLIRAWDNGEKPMVLFIGLNPSTADEHEDDPTVRRCVGFADRWGYGAMCMCNLFTYRATSPSDLKHAIGEKPVTAPGAASELISLAEQSRLIVAAWGAHGAVLNRGRDMREQLKEFSDRVWCFGTTKHGHPRHPLYLPNDAELIPFFENAHSSARCRVCGCTDLDCSGCIERTGEPCFWVEPDLCSACADGGEAIGGQY